MSSGSGASAGRSQPSASAWARAASRLDRVRVGARAAGGEAEQVRRHRRGRPLDVVGGTLGQVEHQALVDLGLDVEDVAQLVDPVVQVHGPTFANERRPRNPLTARISRRPVTGRSRRSVQVSTSRCSSPPAATSTRSSGCEQPAQRQAVLLRRSARRRQPRGVQRRRASWRRPSGSTSTAPSRPAAARVQPAEGRRR